MGQTLSAVSSHQTAIEGFPRMRYFRKGSGNFSFRYLEMQRLHES